MSKLLLLISVKQEKQRAKSQMAVLNHHSQTVNINAVFSNVITSFQSEQASCR